jgi:hypothetical protein
MSCSTSGTAPGSEEPRPSAVSVQELGDLIHCTNIHKAPTVWDCVSSHIAQYCKRTVKLLMS